MIIVGAKGFAKEVLEILHQLNYRDTIFFFDNVSKDISNEVFSRFRVLRSFEEVSEVFKTQSNKFTLGIGNPINRYTLYNEFLKRGGQFSSTISPFARIGNFDNQIDEGCNIMTGTVITNSIQIGKGVLLNLNCTVGHDSRIGNFSEFSPGTHISGNCDVGEFCVFGTNSTMLPKTKIGFNVIVGAGAVITKDVPSNTLVVGVPAKIVKELPVLSLS
ncbi:MAG: acetyltransferase [Cyclobacteriaceae bacterium]|nr:acetyltransferase [Cyclobacteriaceae bacterium]